MSTPQKPWESFGSSQERDHFSNSRLGIPTGRNILNSNAPLMTSQPAGSVRTGVLPPLPPRPPQLAMSQPNRPTFGMPGGYSYPSMYGGYNSGYGGYSYGSYPGSMYMQGGYGYGSYGQPGGAFENRVLQAAEESSRGAFQSIESLVRAFTSVSMMLDSTYHAMYSSFRAILGVMDNFSRLRQLFAQFISAIAVLRIIKNFYRQLLHWMGIIDHSPQSEKIWETVSAGATNNQVSTSSSWPLFTFIGFLLGGPYLISKLFSSCTSEPKTWDYKRGSFCKASYPHEAASEAELSFSENEVLNIAPPELQLQDCPGWLLAANRQGKVGYVPVTRLSAQPRPQVRLDQAQTSTNFSGGESTFNPMT